MSQMMGSSGGSGMSDREIAEDILAGQKYLSNYYYAPAILEAGEPELRTSFQEVHAGVTGAAKDVFDYMHAKGWYRTRSADEEDLADLRNAVDQSRQTLLHQNSIGGTAMSMNQGQQGWTGTQSMEGQSGMGPSSISQGAQWGGEPSWSTGFGGQQQSGMQGGNLPSWTRGGMSAQQSGFGGQGWTGTQSMEGQSGMGPSSISQGARWGGEPSWNVGFGGQYQSQSSLPSWTRGGISGQQGGFGGQGAYGAQQQGGGFGGQVWTGTQAGEGQGGYGPSSLSQGARWGGEPSWNVGYGGQYQSSQQPSIPAWARGGFGGQPGGYGGQQMAPGGPGAHIWRSSFQTGSSGWTGTQAGEGQGGYGPSSLGSYSTGNWQNPSYGQRQSSGAWPQSGQGNWQSGQ